MHRFFKEFTLIGVFIDIGVGIDRGEHAVAVVIVDDVAIDTVSIPITIEGFSCPTITIIVDVADALRLLPIPIGGILIDEAIAIVVP